ncbi:hypothetical protein Vretimale_19710 [Volvox reticuliferus]|uniref:Uncharacterized protein n=1 Tax=Volvox reticuliferus TaxID=1737510 RepID=A0A8J4LZJ3_9CHLO|nr:hypothetical protein Vretimale_19710 [Volvox reticuliferus]
MFVNANAPIPFSGSLGSSAYPYVYYGDQAITSQRSGGTVASEAHGGRGVSGAQIAAPLHSTSAAPWSHSTHTANAPAWPGQQATPGHAMISGIPSSLSAQNAQKEGLQMQKIQDLERDLQLARAQCEQHQKEGRIALAQVENLTTELAAECQRSDELRRQLYSLTAAHQALQAEHQRLLAQHTAIVREHEHMTSAQAASLRELEARHADVSRLQRLLEETQAVVAAANAEAASAAGAQQGQTGGASGHRASIPPPRRVSGVHLSVADEERWALRLQKAERALEEERRVSEDLRQQLKVAEMESRAMKKKLEEGLESPSGNVMPVVSSDPLPKSPRVLSPLSLAAQPLGVTFSGGLVGVGSGPLHALAGGQPSVAGAALGRAASAGSSVGHVHAGGAKLGTLSSAFASEARGAVSIGGAGGSSSSSSGVTPQSHPHEEQVARLKQEVDGLRSDLTRLAATEEMHRVTARAAEDRARAAELVSLDVRRQCDQAARTIGRLIDENTELVAKVNAQANTLADCKNTAANSEVKLRNLEARLAEAQAELAAAQKAQEQGQVQLSSDSLQQQQFKEQGHGHSPSNSRDPTAVSRGPCGDGAPPHGSTPLPKPHPLKETGRPDHSDAVLLGPAREVLLPGSALTEADWKLVMLAEEVRRLVEEVSLSTTACAALQLKQQCGKPSPGEALHRNHHVTGELASRPTSDSSVAGGAAATSVAASGEPQASPLDLPRILSRLEGLAGRHLGPGETAAYILELAGHMEALEQVLQRQKLRMAALRQCQMETGAELGPGFGGDANAGADRGSGPGTAFNGDGKTSIRPMQAVPLVQISQQQQQARVQADPGQCGSTQVVEERQLKMQTQEEHVQTGRQDHAGGARPLGEAGQRDARDSASAFAAGTLAAAGNSRAPLRDTAFGSLVDDGSRGQQQQQGQSLLPQAPLQTSALALPAMHHIVSPFNSLAQRRDAHIQPLSLPNLGIQQPADGLQPQQGQQQHQQLRQGKSGGTAADGLQTSDGTKLDFRSTQRSDLAAAAAAAVAAATAAATVAEVEAEAGGPTTGSDTAAGAAAAVPMLLQPHEVAVPALSPHFAPEAAAVGPAAPPHGIAVAAGVDGLGAGALLDDELSLDEAAVNRLKPRRSRVGLWGWISGEPPR